jgi:hypothetical protein
MLNAPIADVFHCFNAKIVATTRHLGSKETLSRVLGSCIVCEQRVERVQQMAFLLNVSDFQMLRIELLPFSPLQRNGALF